MKLRCARWVCLVALVMGVGLSGCGSGSPKPPVTNGGANGGNAGASGLTSNDGTKSDGAGGDKTNGDKPEGDAPKANGHVAAKGWDGFPDVPYVEVMTEIDGIPIPRLETKTETLKLKGELPADVGNEHAKAKASKPERGDAIIIRFNSEPKTLNPIVETSVVQSVIGEYVQEALARQNPETLEFEPNVAEKWVAEDSVKLSAEFPGKERRVAVEKGAAAAETTLTYPAKKDPNDAKEKDAEFTVAVTTKDGQPAPETWVGLFPVGKIVGAPINGYHQWTGKDGLTKVSGLAPGKYTVRAGAELFGKTKKGDDGSLVVTPATPGNPLNEELKSGKDESLTLKKGEWVDVQEQTIYTFFLRKDVKWSDGTPFTTKDLQLGYAAINNEFVDGESLRVYYQDLIECQPLDERVIRMKYRQQYFKAFEFTAGLATQTPPWHVFEKFFKDDGLTLTLDRLTPAEEESQKKVSAYGKKFGKFFNTDDRYNLAPLGTGPYVVTKWTRGDRVELTRNPNYWNQKRPGYLDKIVVRFIPDNVTAFQALKAGEIDFFWNMDTEQYHRDLAGPPEWFQEKYVKAKWYSPGFSYVGWNLLKPMFQDQKVRVALGLLFDKQAFLDQKLYGDAQIVSGSQYYFGPGYDHEVKPLAYDPDTARDLLSAAGWIDSDNDGVLDKDGKKFEFKYMISQGNKIAEERAEVYQKSLKDVGIQMEIRKLEWASFIDKVKPKDYDVVSLGWGQPLESDPYQVWHGSGAGADKRGSNHVSFSDPLADQIIETLRLTLDEPKRARLNYSLHRILDREQPYMFLYLPLDHGAYHKRFRGVKWYRVRPGFDLSEWYVPKDEQIHK